MSATCEIEGCHAPASVHIMNPRRRVCAECAAEHVPCELNGEPGSCPCLVHLPDGAPRPAQVLCDECLEGIAFCEEPYEPEPEPARFPRAACVLNMVAIAEVLRSAATELDELAGSAPAYELGTLRRKARAIVLAALGFAEGSNELDGQP